MLDRINKKRQYVLSVVVPAYNEEYNLEPTIETIFKVNEKFNHIIKILIINDGSADNTSQVANSLALRYSNIKVLHHKFPKGLGTIFNTALILSEGDYFCLIPGDNQISEEYMYTLFQKAGEVDVVLSYPQNPKIRPMRRQIISKFFVFIYNFLFGLRLKYYNGPALFDLNKLKTIDMSTRFFSYHAEYATRFIKYGYSFTEVGGLLKERRYGRSTALSRLSLLGVIFGTLLLFIDVYYFRRNLYCKKSKREDCIIL